MNSNIPRPTWRKPEPPKSFWHKIFTGMLGTLGGFGAVIPIPKNIFLRPMSYFVRNLEQKPEEKAETKASDQKVKEIISQDVSRQVALWSEAADEEKDVTVYKVQSGDSLWKIAQNQYGRGERWIDIWIANRVSIKEPNLIFSGQELKIPKQILRRTALFQSPAPQKPAVKTAGGELIKKQIVTTARSIEQTGLKTVALINQKLITTGITGEQKTIALQVANQINGNIIDARSYARQAESITDFNANSIDLSVRTLDLGRETIQLARAAEAIPSPVAVSTAPIMAWSQDSAGNIKYYTMKNGIWAPNEVNPIGNIGAIYGTQDITQTPEYKSGKIIKISPQTSPKAPAAPAPAPYGGAILNTEQQKIYDELQSTRGVDAEFYKQVVLSSSPLVVAANAAVVKVDTGVVAFNTSVVSQTVGESISAGPVKTSSVLEKSITAAATTIIATSGITSGAAKISQDPILAENMKKLAVTSFNQVQNELAAGKKQAAIISGVTAVSAAVAANVAAPASPAAAQATATAVQAVGILEDKLSTGGDGGGSSSSVTGPSATGIANTGTSNVSAPTASIPGGEFSGGFTALGGLISTGNLGIMGQTSGPVAQAISNATGIPVNAVIAGMAIVGAVPVVGPVMSAINVADTIALNMQNAQMAQNLNEGMFNPESGNLPAAPVPATPFSFTPSIDDISDITLGVQGVESANTAVPTTQTASEPSAPGFNYLSMQAKALGISISDIIGNLEATNQITPEQAASLRSTAVGLAPADVGLTPADVDDTSDITLGVQGVVGSAYSAVTDMVANESATTLGMTSSEAGTRTSVEVAAQNASNPALAGGSMMGNSTSVSTSAGLTGTVGIMSFGAGQLTAMTVTLSNGVTAAFGSNSGTLTSQGLTNSEANQAIALALAQTQQALNQMSQPRGVDTPDPTPQTNEEMGLVDEGIGMTSSTPQSDVDMGQVDAGIGMTGEGGGPGSGPSGGPSGGPSSDGPSSGGGSGGEAP